MSESEKIHVLFVCLGNICRSPMAEAVFNHVLVEKDLQDRFYVESAATATYNIGDPPDSRSIHTCNKHGVPVADRTARQITKSDFAKFHYVFGMDNKNLRALENLRPNESTAIVKLFGDYDPEGDRIIDDPYYGGTEGFERNFGQVTRCAHAFLETLGL